MFHIFGYFILGMLFALYVNPILTTLVEVILTYLEVLKGKASLNLSQLNVEIQKTAEIDDIKQPVIGFAIPEEEYYEEDED